MKNQATCFLAACLLLFVFSCSKETNGPLNNPRFTANVNGKQVRFMSPVTAQSVKKTNGSYDLYIEGEEHINNDSSIMIRFVIPDFTVSGAQSASHQLTTQFNGNFIEWKTSPNSTSGRFHYFQNGQLSVQQDARSYLKGSFSFTYFLFDRLGDKTEEVVVTEGSFSDVIIER